MSHTTGLEIAVIGMSGRFPGAQNIDEFWNNLKMARESVSFFSEEELRQNGVDPKLIADPSYVKTKGGILEDADCFDAAFFGYIPAEAEVMDPQFRVFHETTWKTLEDAGYDPFSYEGVIGIYAGASFNFDWQALMTLSGKRDKLGIFESHHLINKDFLCTKVSYKLNLKGPALLVQSACSTSLAAIHLASRSLLTGESDMALAGGVSLGLEKKNGYLYREGAISSPDGHCRTFDAEARGTIEGRGVGIVLLKKLKPALRDGDHIYAVIKGSAMNNDGIRKVGFTAPSILGQADVIRLAMRLSKVEPETIKFIETHGTGTVLGDPVEFEALKLAFDTGEKRYCALGSVKPNIGHLDAAAGVTGFIKTVWVLKSRLIPPLLHFKSPNPKIDLENSPFYINTGLKTFEDQAHPLRAGVSSLGIGGTNVHVVLEEAPISTHALHPDKIEETFQLLMLSARTPSSLKRATQNLAYHLTKESKRNLRLADVAFTLQEGRRSFEYRKTYVCSSIKEAIGKLKVGEVASNPIREENKRTTIFMFPGIGSQYIDMGYDLYQEIPLFRFQLDQCLEQLQAQVDFDARNILFPNLYKESTFKDISAEEIPGHSQFAYLSVFLIEYTLAQVLMGIGIKPAAMIGYSFGEYTAACVAGVLSLKEALELVIYRGKLVSETSGGGMLSVPLPAEEVKKILPSDLNLAIDNGLSSIVAGPEGSLALFEKHMKRQKYLCLRINNPYAVHSEEMKSLLHQVEAKATELQLHEPSIPYISNVTGDWITSDQAKDPSYWAAHLGQTVRFADGIKKIVKDPDILILEVGPGRELTNLVKRFITGTSNQVVLDLVRNQAKEVSDTGYLLHRLGQMWQYGMTIQWRKLFPQEERYRVPLPTYPFEKQRFPVDISVLKRNPVADIFKKKGHRFYLPQWQEKQCVLNNLTLPEEPQQYLVYLDTTGFGEELIKRLKTRGHRVVTVQKGTQWQKKNPNHYIIDPAQKKDYFQLFAELKADQRTPQRILHLWGITCHLDKEEESVKFEELQDSGFYSLIYTAKAISQLRLENHYSLEVITNQVYEVTGEESLSPGKATILGPLKVIPQEYPGVFTRHMDITLPETGTFREEELLDYLEREVTTLRNNGEAEPEPVVAYRGTWRRVLTYTPLEVKENQKGTVNIREKGVYLITGGLGNIGLSIAEYLAETYNARILLVGRNPLPLPEIQENKKGDRQEIQKIEQLTRIRQGQDKGQYKILIADVSQEDQLKRVKKQVEGEWGRINGIIHAAGITIGPSFKSIQQIERQDCELQYPSKVNALINLEKIFEGPSLDFCWMMSSLSTLLGGLEFVAYAAVNAYMDAFVRQHNRNSRIKWNSVDWEGMSSKETPQAFQQILDQLPLQQVVVSRSGDLRERLDKWVNLKEVRQVQTPEKPAKKETHGFPRPHLMTPYVPAQTKLEQQLVEILQEFFGYEKLGIQDDFFELGGDSLKAITLVMKIHQQLNAQVPLMEFFNRPTVQQLTLYLKNAKETTFSSIQPVEEKEYYPLTPAQKRLYVLQQMEKESIAYNGPQVVTLEGQIDPSMLQKTVDKLIQRHDSFRTSILILDWESFQRVQRPGEVTAEVEYQDLTTPGTETKEESVTTAVNQWVRPFDLSKAPFFRVGLIKKTENQYILLVDLHHIITDGVSHELFVQEFTAIYAGAELTPMKLQFKDYAEWQYRMFQKDSLQDQEAFWLERFKEPAPILDLPLDLPRPQIQSFEGTTLDFRLSPKESQALREFSVKEKVSLYMVILATFNLLLCRLSGTEDIAVGTPVMGRRHADLEPIIGIFLNTLVLRNHPKGEKTFTQFLTEVKDTSLEAFENQEYPFEVLVEKVAVNRDPSRNPLFDVMLVFQNVKTQKKAKQNVKLATYNYERKISKFDLTLVGMEINDLVCFTFEYCTRLFYSDTIQRFADFYRNLMKVMLDNPNQQLARMEMISTEERHRVMKDFNQSTEQETGASDILQLLELKKKTYEIALVFEEHTITFQQLEQETQEVAGKLREKGVVENSIVGIMMNTSCALVTGILGILKSGAAYLPLDPFYPKERKNFFIRDSQMNLILTQGDTQAFDTGIGVELLDISLITINKHIAGEVHPPCTDSHLAMTDVSALSEDRLIYVIYTSGTTRRPKGVLVNHKSLVNFVKWRKEYYGYSEKDITLQLFSLSFDGFGANFYSSLCSRGQLVLVPDTKKADMEYVKDTIQSNKVSITTMVPSMYEALLDSIAPNQLDTLRYIVLAGEKTPSAVIEKSRRTLPQTKLSNEYGPTETCIGITANMNMLQEGPEMIGNPIPGVQIYILDLYMNPCAIGIPGMMYVGGACVSRGYMNRVPDVAAQFIPNPFQEGTRIYRTGDLGMWTSEDKIKFLGRKDHQVKIRGYRIEPGEIENRLLGHPQIQETVVQAIEENEGNSHLCAWYVSAEEIPSVEIRDFLSKDLPNYMIPTNFIALEKTPLTANGKIDRRALPKTGQTIGDVIAPRNLQEVSLQGLWQEVLNISKEKIGIDHPFFELGGHSLKASILMAKINKRFGTQLALLEIFKTPTIRGLAGIIIKGDRQKKTGTGTVTGTETGTGDLIRIEKREYYPLSFKQKRLWILQKMEPETSAYTITGQIQLHHKVEESHIKKTLEQLIDRYQSFRTRFITPPLHEEPCQVILPNVELPFRVIDLSSLAPEIQKQKREEILIQEGAVSFQLSHTPLCQFLLLGLGEKFCELHFSMHHIIVDGWSLEILKTEFLQVYNACVKGTAAHLKPLEYHYIDFAYWDNQWLSDPEIGARSHQFWKEKLSKGILPIELPTDSRGGANPGKKGSLYRCVVGKEVKERVQQLVLEHQTTLFTTLFSVCNILLSHLSGQREITTSIVSAGREHEALHKIVGFFVNSVLFTCRVDHEEGFSDFLRRMNRELVETLEHQNYPLEKVCEECRIQFPQVQVAFNMMNVLEQTQQIEIKDKSSYNHQMPGDVKFDMEIFAAEYKNGIEIACKYNESLFRFSTIEYIVNSYVKLLESLTSGYEVRNVEPT
jgi:iturin family lipopeptide synthetase A